ncbi:MAG: methylmalonyl-CoA mutase family protein [Bacteroidetes bacterium]|nr:methylmalonyl-CoA mutase family protein [Bacteroidota bacterium]MDA1268692.1 methylmalonyl-CoA mutase family protein [Bacteroidota bacterium]
MEQDLFSGFSNTTKEDWLRQATADLKGRGEAQNLGNKLWDTLSLQPLYALEDLAHPVQQRRFHAVSEFPGMPPRLWTNVVTVLPNDTNADLLLALENGAEGLVLPLHGTEDLQELLDGVMPEYISIYLLPLGNPVSALRLFQDWVERSAVDPALIQGGILWSPSDLVFDHKQELGLGVELLEELLELTEGYSLFKAFCIKTSRYSESGSHPLDALTFVLGELVEILDRVSAAPSLVFDKLFLETAVGDHHFGEVARQLAFRQLVQQLAQLYKVQVMEQELHLFCQTSHWSQSILDVHTNMIRQTYEALSAVLGGANVLWIKPLDEENASVRERRVARNVSTVLKEEAYLDKVQDPAAGSYFLENLVVDLVKESQTALTQLEQEGGWWIACQSGKLQARVKIHRAKIQGELLDKARVKVGANAYAAPSSLTYNKPFSPFKEAAKELKPTRATYLVESLTLDSQ